MVARTYYAEAIVLARALDDRWRLSQIVTWQANTAIMTGDAITGHAAAEEGRRLGDSIGDRPNSRGCAVYLGWAQVMQGDLVAAVAQFRETVADCEQAHDSWHKLACLHGLGTALAYQGEVSAARAAADAAREVGAEMGGYFLAPGESTLSAAALAGGELETARDASEAAARHWALANSQVTAAQRAIHGSEAALADGDLISAWRWADDAVSVLVGWHLAQAMTTRARVAIARDEPARAERDAHDALAAQLIPGRTWPSPTCSNFWRGWTTGAGTNIPPGSSVPQRLSGKGKRMGLARFAIHPDGYQTSVAALRDIMGKKDFDSAWAAGAALSIEEAIAYAQRGRGERRRPATGWESLIPAERDVVRLACEGLGDKEIATRLFVSPRTVHAHLTHVYTKLGLTSRVRLAQEAARHV